MTFKTIQDISQEYNISERTLRQRAKKLGFTHIAGRWLLNKKQVDLLLDKNQHKAGRPCKSH